MTHSLHNILISGFTQHEGRMQGIFALREKLINAGHSQGPRFRVRSFPWNASLGQIAEEVQIVSTYYGHKPVVNLAGYSYGGWAAIRFAGELETRGIDVDILTLCDPVARPNWWPRPLPAASSMLGRNWSRVLRIPNNVLCMNEFRQTENRPCGHRLEIPAATQLKLSQQLMRRHEDMDDAPEFHQAVIEAAGVLRGLIDATTYSGAGA